MGDPGEEPGGALPSYFWTKLRPEGPKKKFLSKGLDDCPPPHLLSEGLNPPLNFTCLVNVYAFNSFKLHFKIMRIIFSHQVLMWRQLNTVA